MISNFGSTNKNKLFELFQESLKIVLKLEKWIITFGKIKKTPAIEIQQYL
jgi:hypothetical protein